MDASTVLLSLNVSQLRNLRNWPRADLPSMVLTAVVPVERRLTVPEAMETVGELVRAHEGLRSRLTDEPRQEVLPPDAVDVRLEVVDCGSEVLADPGTWATLPVYPAEGSFRGVLYTRDRLVVAIKLSLSHVFVDALGKQAAARHLRQLIARRPARRVPKQASAFANGPDDPAVLRNTGYWKELLADAPRSGTYGGATRETVQVAQRRLTADETRRLRTACARLRVSPHTAWVAALSLVAGRQRQVFKTTYANRVTPADFGAVVQVAQPVFPRIAGNERDTLRSRTGAVEQALAEGKRRSMYDANALLEWLNARGAVFQPAFEVNFVPTVDQHEARLLHGPAADDVWFEETRVDPLAGKPEIVLLVRHLPEPLVRLTARRPACEGRDARRIVDDCLRVIDAL